MCPRIAIWYTTIKMVYEACPNPDGAAADRSLAHAWMWLQSPGTD